MKLRGCIASHFIASIQKGEVKKVHNTDSYGRPKIMFKKIEDMYQHENDEFTPLALADRSTRGSEYEADGEDLTLLQIKKTCKRKKRKASEAGLLIPKEEEDDSDLSEPLFKFRVKGLKRLKSKKKPDNGCFPISDPRKDFATLNVKVEVPDFDCGEMSHTADGPLVCDESVRFIASDNGFVLINPVPESMESGSEVSIDSLEIMEVDNEENSVNGYSPLSVSEVENEENTVYGPMSLTVLEVENEEHTVYGPMPLSVSEGENEENLVNCILPLSVSEVENEENTVNGLVRFSVSEVENEENTVNGLLPLSVSEVENEENSVNGLPPLSVSEVVNEENTVNGLLPVSVSEVVNEENTVNHLLPLSVSKVENEENMVNGLLPLSVSEVVNEENTLNSLLPLSVSEVEKEEYVNQSSFFISSMKDDSSLEDLTASTSDCSQSQQTPEEVDYISSGQNSDSTVGEASVRNLEICSPSPVSDSLNLPWSQSLLSPDNHTDDVVHTEAKLIESEEKQHLTLEDSVAESNSMGHEHTVFVPANTDSEVKLDHDYQSDIKSETSEIENSCCVENRQPERLPLTRKVISPNSQRKLCQAMEAAELTDDMDHYKCKEKLYFEEQVEDNVSSTKLDVENIEQNLHPQQGLQSIQNKAGISSKHVLRRTKHYKKGSPPKKGCLDGPRLCRSLPRLSTGCTSIQGCSESAIAFSQRQMHDIETLASKLMSELDSMKAFVEEKMLFEAYRSPSLKNDADEVKSAIKSATKTEEAAKKWLTMMTRDCNRFCKIMKLNEDDDTSASADPATGNTIHEKPLQKERKKISFADEAGGMLCDIKVFQIDRDSLEQ